MFEGLLERLLLRLFGQYVADFNREQLHISVWAGDVKLHRLKLRRGALDELKLPIDVFDGQIEELHVKVPWSRLASSPVQVFVNGIHVLAKPVQQEKDNASSAAALQRLAQVLKKRQLAAFEADAAKALDEETADSGASGSQQQQSFSGRLLARVWANVQLVVRDVHIRYEDDVTLAPQRTFAAGLIVHELSAVTTDSSGDAKWIEPDVNATETHKKLQLQGGALYWNSFSRKSMWHKIDVSEQRFLHLKHATSSRSTSDYDYVVQPLDATMQVVIHHDVQLLIEQGNRTAKTDVALQLSNFAIHFRQHQYNDLTRLANYLTAIQQQQQTATILARLPSLPKRTGHSHWPRQYWQHSCRCIIALRNKRLRFDWQSIQQHSIDRQAYIQLWIRHLYQQQHHSADADSKQSVIQPPTTPTSSAPSATRLYAPLSAEEQEQLTKLEQRLSVESIIVFRTLAQSQLKLRTMHLAALKQQQRRNQTFSSALPGTNPPSPNSIPAATGGGWFGQLGRLVTGSAAPTASASSVEDETELQGEWRQVLEQLSLSSDQQRAVWETGTVSLPASFINLRATVQLTNAAVELSKSSADGSAVDRIVSLVWSGEFRFDRRPTSWHAVASVQQVKLIDHQVNHSVHRNVLSFNGKASRNKPCAVLEIEDHPAEVDPTCRADTRIKLDSAPCTFILATPFVEALMRWAHQPHSAALAVRADQWKADARNNFVTALNNHRALDVSVNIKSPTLLIPANARDKQSAVLVARIKTLEFHSLDASKEVDTFELRELYDAFQLQLLGMQLSSATSFNAVAQAQDEQSDSLTHIVSGGVEGQNELSNYSVLHSDEGFDVKVQLYTSTRNAVNAHITQQVDRIVSCKTTTTDGSSNIITVPTKLILKVNLPRLHVALTRSTGVLIKRVRKQFAHLATLRYDSDDVASEQATAIQVPATDTVNALIYTAAPSTPTTPRNGDYELTSASASPATVATRVAAGSTQQEASKSSYKAPDYTFAPVVRLRCEFAINNVRLDVLRLPDNVGDEQPPSSIVFSVRVGDLSGNIHQTATLLYGSLRLGSFNVLDLLQPNAPPSPFAVLATSTQLPSLTHDPARHERWRLGDAESSKADNTLIDVKFNRLLKAGIVEVQHLEDTPYTTIELAFNALHVNWNPDTIAQVLLWARSSDNDSSDNATIQVQRVPSSPSQHQRTSSTASSAASHKQQMSTITPTSTSVQATMRRLTISFNKELEQRHIVGLLMENATVQHTQYAFPAPLKCSTSRTIGSLGDIRLIDLATDHTLYTDLFRLRDVDPSVTSSHTHFANNSVLTFTFSNYQSRCNRPQLPQSTDNAAIQKQVLSQLGRFPDTETVLRVNTVRFVFMQQVMFELIDYFQEGILSAISVRMTDVLSSGLDAAASSKYHKLDISFYNPVVSLPRKPTLQQLLEADLGVIHVCNAIIDSRLQIGIDVTGARLLSATLAPNLPSTISADHQRWLPPQMMESLSYPHTGRITADLGRPPMLDVDLSVRIVVPEPVPKRRPTDSTYHDCHIDIQADRVVGVMSFTQYILLLQVFDENIKAPPPTGLTSNQAVNGMAVRQQSVPQPQRSPNTAITYHVYDDRIPLSFHVNIFMEETSIKLLQGIGYTDADELESDADDTDADSSTQNMNRFLDIADRLIEPVETPLTSIHLDGFTYHMKRSVVGDMRSRISMRSVSCIDLRTSSKHMPYNMMLCPFAELQERLADMQSKSSVHDQSSNHRMYHTASSRDRRATIEVETEVEFTWHDFPSGRRDMALRVSNPCGYIIPSYWMDVSKFFGEGVEIAWGERNAKEQLAAQIKQQMQQMSNTGAKIDNNLLFRSFDLSLTDCRLILLKDAKQRHTQAVVLSGDMKMEYTSTMPKLLYGITEPTDRFQSHSFRRTLTVDRIRAFVAPADQPYFETAHSIVTPCTFTWKVQQRTERCYVRQRLQRHQAPQLVQQVINTISQDLSLQPTDAGASIEIRAAIQDFFLILAVVDALKASVATQPHVAPSTTNPSLTQSSVASVESSPMPAQRQLNAITTTVPERFESTTEHRINWGLLTIVLINDVGGSYVPLLNIRLRSGDAIVVSKQKEISRPLDKSRLLDVSDTESTFSAGSRRDILRAQERDIRDARRSAAAAESDNDSEYGSTQLNNQGDDAVLVSVDDLGEERATKPDGDTTRVVGMFTLSVLVDMDVLYFNSLAVAWEALIEAGKYDLKVHQESEHFRLQNLEAGDSDDGVEPKPVADNAVAAPTTAEEVAPGAVPELTVTLALLQPLHLNMTHVFIQTLLNSVSAFKEASKSTQRRTVFAPYVLLNYTGTDVAFHCHYANRHNQHQRLAEAQAEKHTSGPVTTVTNSLTNGWISDDYASTVRVLHSAETERIDIRYLAALDGVSADDVYSRILSSRETFAISLRAPGGWVSVDEIAVQNVGTNTHLMAQITTNSQAAEHSPADPFSILTHPIDAKHADHRQLLYVDTAMIDGSKHIMLRTAVELVNRTHQTVVYVVHSKNNTLMQDGVQQQLLQWHEQNSHSLRTADIVYMHQHNPPAATQNGSSEAVTHSFAVVGTASPSSSLCIPLHLLHLEYVTAIPMEALSTADSDSKTKPLSGLDTAISHKRCLGTLHAVSSGKIYQYNAPLNFVQHCHSATAQTRYHVTACQSVAGGFYHCKQFSTIGRTAGRGRQGQQAPTLTLIYDAPVMLHNLFPYPYQWSITYTRTQDTTTGKLVETRESHRTGSLAAGAKLCLMEVDMFRRPALAFQLEGYNWCENIVLYKLNSGESLPELPATHPHAPSPAEHQVVTHQQRQALRATGLNGEKFIVQIESRRTGQQGGALNIALYCQYWLINRTTLDLLVGANVEAAVSGSITTRILPGQCREIEVECYENQRWNVAKSQWLPAFLPTDRPHWSDVNGKHSRAKEYFRLPHEYDDEKQIAASLQGEGQQAQPPWRWTSDWQVDYGLATGGHVDNEGWEYGLDFMWEYHSSYKKTDHVRRRRWVRTYTSTEALHTICCYSSSVTRPEQICVTLQPTRTRAAQLANNTEQDTSIQYPFSQLLSQTSTWSVGADPSKRADGVLTCLQQERLQLLPPSASRKQVLLSRAASGGDKGPVVTRDNRYDIGVQYQQAPAPFDRSIVMSFTPRYIIVNRSTSALLVRQHHTSQRCAVTTIPSRTYAPWYWYDAAKTGSSSQQKRDDGSYDTADEQQSTAATSDRLRPYVALAFPPTPAITGTRYQPDDSTDTRQPPLIRWRWSGAFRLDEVGDLPVMVRNSLGHYRGVRVRVHIDSATIFAIVDDEATCKPLYTVHNHTKSSVFIRQKLPYANETSRASVLETLPPLHGSWPPQTYDYKTNTVTTQTKYAEHAAQWIRLQPGESTPYALQEPNAAKPHLIQMIAYVDNSGGTSSGLSSPRNGQRVVDESNFVFCHDLPMDNIGFSRLHSATHLYADVKVDDGVKVIDLLRILPATATSNGNRHLKVPQRSTTQSTLRADPRQQRLLEAIDAQKQSTVAKSEVTAAEKAYLLFTLTIPQAAVSIIDSNPREVALATLSNIGVMVSASNIHQKLQLKVGDLQVDNQLTDAVFPVAFYRKPDYFQAAGSGSGSSAVQPSAAAGQHPTKPAVGVQSLPLFYASANRLTKSTSLEHYKYIEAVFQEFQLKLDSSFVMAFVPFLSYGGNSRAAMQEEAQLNSVDFDVVERYIASPLYIKHGLNTVPVAVQLDTHADGDILVPSLEPNPTLPIDAASTLHSFAVTTVHRLTDELELAHSKLLYIEQLVLHSVQFTMTFFSLPSTDGTGGGGISLFGIGTLASLFSTMMLSVANIENARLELGGRSITHAMATRQSLGSLLLVVYRRQLLSQMYEVLGSSHALGNPIGLLSNIGTGVYDLFNEPATALMKGPSEFGVGLAVGVGSFFKNTLYGVANSASSITGTIGNAAAAVTFDPAYMSDRTRSRIKQPTHVGSGLFNGTMHFGRGLFEGVSGLVRSPAEGAYNEGLQGFVKGVGRGVVGLVAKPVAGTFDAVASLTDGIKNTTTMFDRRLEPRRQRPPRVFYYGLVKPYSVQQLTASYILTINGNINLTRHTNELYRDHIAVTLRTGRRSSRELEQGSPERNANAAEIDDEEWLLQRQLPGGTQRHDLLMIYHCVAYVVTDQSIITARLHAAKLRASVHWSCRWSQVLRIERHSPTAVLVVQKPATQSTSSSIHTGAHAQSLQCPTEDTADQLESILVQAHASTFNQLLNKPPSADEL